MEQIRISLDEVSEIASSIRLLNSNLDDVLAYVNRTMHELSSVWISEGAETLMNRFSSFASRFLKESETIENYARFLDYTVSSYGSLESTITANASSFD